LIGGKKAIAIMAVIKIKSLIESGGISLRELER
jgi:hypothetical protein